MDTKPTSRQTDRQTDTHKEVSLERVFAWGGDAPTMDACWTDDVWQHVVLDMFHLTLLPGRSLFYAARINNLLWRTTLSAFAFLLPVTTARSDPLKYSIVHMRTLDNRLSAAWKYNTTWEIQWGILKQSGWKRNCNQVEVKSSNDRFLEIIGNVIFAMTRTVNQNQGVWGKTMWINLRSIFAVEHHW